MDRVWNEIPSMINNVSLDDYIILPNHLHGIVCKEGAASGAPTLETEGSNGTDVSLGRVIRAFKSKSAVEIGARIGMRQSKFWQRGFYDRIVRTEIELNRIREYIERNPGRWSDDSNNPEAERPQEDPTAWYE